MSKTIADERRGKRPAPAPAVETHHQPVLARGTRDRLSPMLNDDHDTLVVADPDEPRFIPRDAAEVEAEGDEHDAEPDLQGDLHGDDAAIDAHMLELAKRRFGIS